MTALIAFFRIQFLLARANFSDTLSGVASSIVYALINLFALTAILAVGNDVIEAWKILLVAGALRIGWALSEAVTENLWSVGSFARTGELVYYKVSPVPTLFHLIASRFQFDRLIDVGWGIGYMVVASQMDGFQTSLRVFAGAGIVITLSCLAFFSVTLIGASISVATQSEGGAWMSAAAQASELALFPAPLYRRILPEAILILPVFLPGLAGLSLIDNDRLLSIALAAIVVMTFSISAFAIWKFAIERYDGTGS